MAKRNTNPGIGESADSGVMHNPQPSRARTHARVVDRRDIKDIPCSQTARACTCTRTRTRVENPAAYFKAWRLAKWGGDFDPVRVAVDEAVASGAHALFMPHGLGHNMGLDVHDMEDLGENYVGYDDTIQRSTQFGLASLRMGRMLQPGHVLTVEPGIYFIPALIDKWKAEGINKDFVNFEALDAYRTFGGIRLEDDVLVTEDGARRLGPQRLPIKSSDIEEIMANE